MANKWIEHVKNYSKLHNKKYSESLKDPKCKEEYQKMKGGGLYPSSLPGKGTVKGTVKNIAKNVKDKAIDKVIDTTKELIKSKTDKVLGMGVVKKQNKKMNGKGKLSEIKSDLLDNE